MSSDGSDVKGSKLGRVYENFIATQYPDQHEFLVGTKADIEAQHETCSFCDFVHTRIVARGFDNVDENTRCIAHTPGSSEEVWLQLQDENGGFVGGLLGGGERILFVADSHHLSPRAGKIVGNDEVDYARVRSWLQTCDKEHQDMCPMPSASKSRLSDEGVPSLLLVLDLKRDCLTEISWQERYVALSYVWGSAVPPKLLSKDLEGFKNAQSLTEIRRSMPQTVRDAMHFATKIGLRYFWFDSFCLIQDDPVTLKKGINTMDVVYESAYLTVIAAAGPGADHGLPGVGNTPRQLPQKVIAVKPGLSLVMVRSMDKHLNDSVWATRGWTLQEHYLSRRTIVFVNDQVYFRCRKRIWSEETWSDIDPVFQNSEEWTTNLVTLAAEVMDEDEFDYAPYDYLVTALPRFQQRVLKYESDALNAMTGILQRVASLGRTTLLQGIPVMVLPPMLIFLHLGKQPDDVVLRRSGFPSWTWAGWKGSPVWFVFNTLDMYRHPEQFIGWPNTKTWIIWYVSRGGKPPELLWTPGDAVPRSEPNNQVVSQDSTYKDHFRALQLDTSSTAPSPMQQSQPYDILTFFTISIFLTVRLIASALTGHDGTHGRMFSAHDIEGNLCGYLYPDVEISYSADEHFELILVADCSGIEFPLRTMNSTGTVDSKRRYWVMLIESTDHGVYERKAVGQVLHEAIEKSYQPGPIWKEIALG